jgi:spore maturation protein CgeB
MKQPKILFVYNGKPLPESRLKAFHALKELSSDIKVMFPYNENYKRTLIDKVFSRLKIPLDPNHINKRILETCKIFKPDIVFIVRGLLIKPTTLQTIKSLGIKSISWSNDDMYARHNRSLWYTWSLKYYDLVGTQKSYNCNANELPSLGAKVLFQNKAFDPKVNYPVENCASFNCVHDVVFVGTKEQDRYEHIRFLAEKGIAVNVYGWGKPDFGTHHENIIFHDRHLFGEEFSAALGCSKIALNFLRKINRDLQTSRSVEIPASRGFMLAERTEEHLKLFQEGMEAEYFSSKEELLEKVQQYLNNETQRRAIAQAGFERCYTSDYTFKNRMQELIQKALNG